MKTLSEIQDEAIVDRLRNLDGNKSDVARSLGISVKTLYNHLERMGIHTKGDPKDRPIRRARKDKGVPRFKNGHQQRKIPSREELLSLDKLNGDWKPKKQTRKYEIKKTNSENHIKIYLEKLEKQKELQREKRKKPVIHWEEDPDFDTGYEQPTPEERDDWYNRDRF